MISAEFHGPCPNFPGARQILIENKIVIISLEREINSIFISFRVSFFEAIKKPHRCVQTKRIEFHADWNIKHEIILVVDEKVTIWRQTFKLESCLPVLCNLQGDMRQLDKLVQRLRDEICYCC
mmetsp:Transcript_7657/g.16546  ORF Transcript_7657/g.16546 Transcript_7657/m.16546 type:complete len:123 (+) Transcript_7657:2082-2450(+)